MKTHIRALVKKCVILFYRLMCVVCPVKKKRIVFDSGLGRSYAGNPRSIYETMVEQGDAEKWDCTWFYESEPHAIPGRAKQIRFGRLRYLYYMATAKVWIFDCRQPEFLKKRKNCYYIQTWHGTPLKKLGLDMDDVFMSAEKDISSYQNAFVKNVRTWDYLISQNPFSTETFRRAFDFKKEMLEIGYPRNDVLFAKNNPEVIRNLRKQLGLPLDKKILLYAPTFRDDEFSANSKYKFQPQMDFSLMQEKLQDEYVLIVKYHYLIMDSVDWSPYEGFVYAFDQSHDIVELFVAADSMITDYSSVMFDYSILRRPMFFFAYDLEKYANDLRGFYFGYREEMPGPISETTEQLVADILQYDASKYQEAYEAFGKKYNPWDDGKASHKVIELVKTWME